ncbi:hypothetical protein CO608_08515 [Lysobacteraceae bacterium NML08-0793]|nr:hypothetical protein CO608_08515 [Xanthomonadaceae bacterium NML08-0793]
MPKHETAKLDIASRHLAVLRQLLAQHVPHTQVWAYGSRVTGTSHEGSDLDLVLRNPANLSLETDARSELQEALRESNLPMLIDLHDWARLPEEFRRTIEYAYVELQAGKQA